MTEERFYYHDPEAPKPNVPVHPGVAAIIFDEQDRILILKRTRGPYWSLPGGRMDPGESAPASCLRETREETGLETRIIRLIGLYSDPQSICSYPDGNVHQSYIALFECAIVSGEFRPSEETTRHHWLSRDELDQFCLLPDNVLCVQDAWMRQAAAMVR